MKKGIFITFEGPDGSGKTTQITKIAAWFAEKGYEVVCTREPGGTKAAESIRAVVLDPKLPIKAEAETLLYLAARADHVEKVIAPGVAAGKVVLCDRFSDSTFVYQGLTRGIKLDVLQRLNAFATQGLQPDVTFLLDGAADKLALRRNERGIQDRLELEGLAFQEKVRQGFLTLAQAEPERIIVINSLQPAAIITAEILQQLKKFI